MKGMPVSYKQWLQAEGCLVYAKYNDTALGSGGRRKFQQRLLNSGHESPIRARRLPWLPKWVKVHIQIHKQIQIHMHKKSRQSHLPAEELKKYQIYVGEERNIKDIAAFSSPLLS